MIPATLNEIEQIFLEAETKQTRSLCVTACQCGDGVTTVATSLAERFLLAGYSTLLVDLNQFKPGFESIPYLSSESSFQWLQPTNGEQVFTGVSLPKHPSVLVNFRNPQFLTQQVGGWLQEFDKVIIDTSPILQNNMGNIPAQSVAAACDHTLLVVLGGSTSEANLANAQQLLERSNADLIGYVLNNMNQCSLGEEMVRELNRLRFIPKTWRDKWSQQILKNEWLSHIA
ncbi:chromosome partitioning protein ParA [Vibrio ponticus]|uniref:Chromosome partitioning protein ParA n=1 Tax=Vibrio ponticus TaxID=265668 RepID=A0A3N3DYY2_9VIBR|nr:chromosome partitioning protein ParA [Vibrio ponticus]ROV59599.1 chromosome partitioning protein ParA [Vibrio ponticus]